MGYRSMVPDQDDIAAFYPSKLDGQCGENVLHEYELNSDPSTANSKSDRILFTDYAPKVFGYLRRRVYGVNDDAYFKSILPIADASKIAVDLVAKFSEGRSGAFFFFTRDMRYLIKTLTHSEAQLLLDTLRKYVHFMRENPKTFLSAYFGLHRIKLYGHSIYFVVNKNIFANLEHQPDETYDIKGSWVDRYTRHHIEDRKLMKDTDMKRRLLLDKLRSFGIYKQLERDAAFLASVNIMDYSLLLGVCYTKVAVPRKQTMVDEDGDVMDEKNEVGNGAQNEIVDAEFVEGAGRYVIGIIDMLQQWDWNKKTERMIKAYLRCKDKEGISCVPPTQYKDRFLEKMVEIGIGHRFGDNVSVVRSE